MQIFQELEWMHHKTLKLQMFFKPINIVKMLNQFNNNNRYRPMRVNLTPFSSEVNSSNNNKLKLQLTSKMLHNKPL